jgi:hypothetical protein
MISSSRNWPIAGAPDLARQLHAFEHPARVPILGQEVAVDLRLLARVTATEDEGSAGVRLDNSNAQRDRSARRTVFRGHKVRDRDVHVQFVAAGFAGLPPQESADRGPHVKRVRLQGVRVVVEGLVLKALPDRQIGYDVDAELR